MKGFGAYAGGSYEATLHTDAQSSTAARASCGPATGSTARRHARASGGIVTGAYGIRAPVPGDAQARRRVTVGLLPCAPPQGDIAPIPHDLLAGATRQRNTATASARGRPISAYQVRGHGLRAIPKLRDLFKAISSTVAAPKGTSPQPRPSVQKPSPKATPPQPRPSVQTPPTNATSPQPQPSVQAPPANATAPQPRPSVQAPPPMATAAVPPPPPTYLPPPGGPWNVDGDRIVPIHFKAGAGRWRLTPVMRQMRDRLARYFGFNPRTRDAGHANKSHWAQKAGEPGTLRNEPAFGPDGNRSRGPKIEGPAARAARANGQFARADGSDPTAPAGARRTPELLNPGRLGVLKRIIGKLAGPAAVVDGVRSAKRLSEDFQMHNNPSSPRLGPVGTRRTDSLGTVWIKIAPDEWVTQAYYDKMS